MPVWALFEIMTMGDFGNLLSCLTYDLRDDITKKLGLNVAYDTNRDLIYLYVYALKDLRNAVAHNAVVFDTRFRRSDPTKAMTQSLKSEFNLPYVNFKTIGDYVILICYYLKLLKVSNSEIRLFIDEFARIVNDYRSAVSTPIADIVIHPDLSSRISILKNFI